MSKINLLPRQREDTLKFLKALKIFRYSSVLAMGLVILSALVVFYLHVQLPLGALQNTESSLLETLNIQKLKIAKLVIMHSQLKDVEEIFKERSVVEMALEEIAGTVPGGVSLSSFSVGLSEVSVSVSSTSLSSIDQFLSIMVDLAKSENKKLFKKVILNGATLDRSTNQYSFSVQGTLL